MLRIPLFIDWTATIPSPTQLSPAEIDEIVKKVCQLWADDPAVLISYVSSSGNLGNLDDTRLQAGSSASSATSFPAEATVQDTSIVTVIYSRLHQNLETESLPTDSSNLRFPLFYDDGHRILLEDEMGYVQYEDNDYVREEQDSSAALQAMSHRDMLDTFIYPAIDLLTSGSTGEDQQGTFYISTALSGITGSTIVSSTPVFVDTRANASAYTASGIPETRDQPTSILNYYLWKIDEVSKSYSELPCKTNHPVGPLRIDVQEYLISSFEGILQDYVRWCALNDTDGYKLRYNINGAGANRGSGMTDTRLNSQTYTTHQVGPDDYRAQKFPSGSNSTIDTYYLKINKE
jgi:hypothetical protein